MPHKSVSQYVEDWGMVDGNVQVQRITLSNNAAINGEKDGGLIACILTYGGIVQRLYTHNSKGELVDVVLGCDNIEGYLKHTGPYFGAMIGRYANRIGGGSIDVDGKNYPITQTEGTTCLHGGKKGWDKYVWQHTIVETEDFIDLVLTRSFPDGDEGFPGDLDAKVTYRMEKQSPKLSFIIDCKLADKTKATATVISVTNHSYFNLEGHDSGKNINDHMCQIDADQMFEASEKNLPTGVRASVKGGPFDFTKAKKIGREIDDVNNVQIKQGKGYDHSWWLGETKTCRKVGYFTSPHSGICLTFHTTQPAVQMYTGNWIDNIPGAYKDKASYGPRAGAAFETANLPDAPHHADFPSCILKKGETYNHTTTWDFCHIE